MWKPDQQWLASNIGATLLAGVWNERALLRRLDTCVGKVGLRWQKRFVVELLTLSKASYPPSPAKLVAICKASSNFARIFGAHQRNSRILHAALKPPRFTPSQRFAHLEIPRLATPGDIARHFGVSAEQLDWLADRRHQHNKTAIPILQHYEYTFVPKPAGPPRLIEAPKSRLKAIQRRILHEILDHVPQHDRAHGFVKGRSCLTSAEKHAGETIVVTLDLKDFFPSTRLSRVHAVFRSLGYPTAAARCLTGLCSTATPRSVFERLPLAQRPDWQTRRAHETPHLAQGAPTSPALANLAAWSLDNRLRGLSMKLGGNYTRYADDLAFSGDEAFIAKTARLIAAVANIATDEGYSINERKTRIMRRDDRQLVTGLVVNDHLNVPRAAYDVLKAILHNCRRGGWRAQNQSGEPDFRAHLDGRITWVENVNRVRGEKLRAVFNEINW